MNDDEIPEDAFEDQECGLCGEPFGDEHRAYGCLNYELGSEYQ